MIDLAASDSTTAGADERSPVQDMASTPPEAAAAANGRSDSPADGAARSDRGATDMDTLPAASPSALDGADPGSGGERHICVACLLCCCPPAVCCA